MHVLARNLEKATKVIEQIKANTSVEVDIRAHEVDLSNLQTIRQFADQYLASQLPIHVLINNAGLGKLLY